MVKILYLTNATSENTRLYLQTNFPMINHQSQKYHSLLIKGLGEISEIQTVSIISMNRRISKKFSFKKNINRENNVLFNEVGFLNFPVFRQISIMMKTILHLIREKKQTDLIIVDVLNFTMLASLQIYKLFNRKIPVIGVVTDIPTYRVSTMSKKGYIKTFYKYYNELNMKLLYKCNAFVCITNQMNEKINKNNKPFVVVEGISNISSENNNLVNRNQNDKFRCFYAGRLDQVFGIKDLIEGFILANLPNSELILYGHGDMVPSIIEDYCKRDTNIKYLGNVENSIIVSEESTMSLLINPRPTNYEYTKYSFPSKNIEYMSSGVPVLTTKLPGMPISYYDYVYLIDNETPEGIALKLRDLYLLPKEDLFTLGFSARSFIIDCTNYRKQADKVLNLYLNTRGSKTK